MARWPRISAAAAAAAALALAACGGDGSTDTTAAGPCTPVAKPAPKKVNLKPPKTELPQGAQVTATVETNCGSFTIALDTERAPKTTSSFAYLVRKGVYDDTPIHRIQPGFVIQGGDPLGNGTGGPGYHVDEAPPNDLAYTHGVAAMARTAAEPPGRSGSQFFVVTTADAGLDPTYALLGEVTKGMDVVDAIGALGTPDGTPTQTVVIKRITLAGA
jgi:cyclophilin family peptidyl-prolyl cis-trans isomerase